jgi:hypothetical protein
MGRPAANRDTLDCLGMRSDGARSPGLLKCHALPRTDASQPMKSRFGFNARGRSLGLAALVLAALALLGADEPDVRRVRVPADKVLSLFPPRSELRWVPRDEFEALVRKAQERAAAGKTSGEARLLRARHFIRWDGGVLHGRTELTVERAEKQRTLLFVEPWTPAVTPSPGAAVVASLENGRTCLWLDPQGPSAVSIRWEQRAREGSNGRSFDIGLPRLDTSTLLVDLPAGIVPSGPPGIRQGPAPSTDPDRRTWRFDGPSGLMTLHVRTSGEPQGPAPPPRIWVGGKTSIDVTEASARWQAQWTVDPGPDGPRRLVVALDDGLRVHEITGPGVASFQNEPAGSLTIRLSDAVAGPTGLAIRGSAPVPDQGPWNVPSARPIDAIWTGGQTSVRLGPSRALEDCQERAGRRIAAQPAELEAEERVGRLLHFDSASPRSVATLTLRRPAPDVSADVLGRLLLGRGSPQFEAVMTWRIHRGRPLSFGVHIPSGWEVDRVSLAGQTASIPWNVEPHPGGGMTLRAPSPSLEMDGSPALFITATALKTKPYGAVALPRPRPIDARIADELWVVKAEPDSEIVPLQARGLAWVDPVVASPDAGRAFTDHEGLRDVLAWRWIDSDGRGELEHRRRETRPVASAWTSVAIERSRVRFDWYISLRLGSATGLPRELPIRIAVDADDALAWRIVGEDGGPSLPSRAASERELSSLGVPGAGPGRFLDLSGVRSRERLLLHARIDRPWSGAQSIPLPSVPSSFGFSGHVLVSADPTWLLTSKSGGMRTLDGSLARRAYTQLIRGELEERSGTPRDDRTAVALAYDVAPASVRVTTEALASLDAGGVIEEARLVTSGGPRGAAAHRLSLRVAATGAQSLGVDLPPGAVLEAATSWGEPLSPTMVGERLTFGLDASTRSRTNHEITLEYSMPAAAGSRLAAGRPQFSLPCLAFRWEVDAPKEAIVSSESPALVDADPAPAPGPPGPATVLRSVSRAVEPAEPLRELNDRIRATEKIEEAHLGDLLVRWDSGQWPVVVDRDAVASTGLGPRSIVNIGRRSTTAGPSAREILEPIGLTITPVGDALLVTSIAEDVQRRRLGIPFEKAEYARLWSRAIRAAAGMGADATSRFRSAADWRESAGFADAPPPPLGRDRRRFVAVGWPDHELLLRLVDGRARLIRSAVLTFAVVLLGFAARRQTTRRRALGLGVVFVTAIVLLVSSPRGEAFEAVGLLAGVATTLSYWFGRAIAASPAPARASERGSSIVRVQSMPGVAVGSVALAALASLGSAAIAVQAPKPSPIIALIPYEGVPDLNENNGRVVVLLKDYERLDAMATAPLPAASSIVTAASVDHQFHRDGLSVIFESRFALQAGDSRSWSWRIPLGEARDVAATLDGRPIAIRITPEGDGGVIEHGVAGDHVLVVRRVLPCWESDVATGFSTPLNAVASARLRGDGLPTGAITRAPAARGEVRSDGAEMSAALGGASRLDVQWSATTAKPTVSPATNLKGVVVWDVEPAGDRVRARWTVDAAEEVSTVRLRLEPGLIVRSATSPGSIDVTWEGTARKPEWLARITPPLRPGQSLSVELFRPVETSSALELAGLESGVRSFPRIERLGNARGDTIFAVRRPSDWIGRFEPPMDFAAATEPELRKSWPDLPESALTFAGSARGSKTPPVSLAFGPAPLSRVVRPDVRVTIEPGRLAVKIAADVEDKSGRNHGLTVKIPPNLQINVIDAEGVTHWTRLSVDRLRLRFDGEAPPRKTIHIDGWIPDPPPDRGNEAAASTFSIAAPWPTWPGAEVESGLMTVSAAAARGARLESPSGAVASGDVVNTTGSSGLLSTAYRGSRPEDFHRLRWNDEPPKVGVRIESLLTVFPKSVVWNAIARYSVTGGSMDRVRIKFPTGWTEGLAIETPGVAVERSEHDGASTILTLRLDQPIWGDREFHLRAERPLPGDGTLVVPDVLPQGRGTFLTDVAIDDASGRDVALEGSSGLQPIESSRFDAVAFPLSPGVRRSVFKVNASRWSLRIRPGLQPPSGPEEAKVAQADYKITIGVDGAAFGRAEFDVEAGAGEYLSMRAPTGLEPLSAEVDGWPTPPLAHSSGRLLIPLRGRRSARVVLLWRSPAGRGRASDWRNLDFPTPLSEGTPLLVQVFAPEGLDVGADGSRWEQLVDPLLQAERLEWAGERILRRLERIDRGSSRERAAMLGELVRFHLQGRRVTRSASYLATDHTALSAETAQRSRTREEAARSSLSQAIRDAGLEDLDRAARIMIAADSPADVASAVDLALPEALEESGPPSIGVSRAFLGELSVEHPPRISWRPRHAPNARLLEAPTSLFLATTGLALIGLGFTSSGRYRPWLSSAFLTGLIAATLPVASMFSPVLVLSAALGWLTSRR